MESKTFLVRLIFTHLSVLIEPVPSVGVSDVWVCLKHLFMDNPFDGDLDVNLDQTDWDIGGIGGCQLQLQHRQVALGPRGMIDQVEVVTEVETFLEGLGLD